MCVMILCHENLPSTMGSRELNNAPHSRPNRYRIGLIHRIIAALPKTPVDSFKRGRRAVRGRVLCYNIKPSKSPVSLSGLVFKLERSHIYSQSDRNPVPLSSWSSVLQECSMKVQRLLATAVFYLAATDTRKQMVFT